MPNQPDEWWPVLEAPSEYADFTFDATSLITVNGVVDPITSLSFAVKPSGAGEVVASRLVPIGSLITVWLTGGVPGRIYTYQLIITTQSGRILPVLIGQTADPTLAQCPIPPPPAPGFGTPLIWVLT